MPNTESILRKTHPGRANSSDLERRGSLLRAELEDVTLVVSVLMDYLPVQNIVDSGHRPFKGALRTGDVYHLFL